MKRSWTSCLLLMPLLLAAQTPPKPAAAETSAIKGSARFAGSNLPVRRAVVELRSRGKKSRQVTTDYQGRFELKDVEPGSYWLSVRREGHVLQRVHIGSRQVPGRAPLLLTLSPRRSITDIVAYFLPQAVIRGRILDAEGEPVNEVNVEVVRVSGSGTAWPSAGAASSQTNDLGEFRIAGLPSGRYQVRVTPLGEQAGTEVPSATSPESHDTLIYTTTYYPGVTDRKQAARLTLRPGEEMEADLILPQVRAVRIRGRVLGIADGSESRVSLILRARDGSMGTYHTLAKPDDGSFEFDAVPPGSYALRAHVSASDFLSDVALPESRRLEVESEDIENLTIVLAPVGKTSVHGRVRFTGSTKTRPTRFLVHLEPEELDEEVREPPRYVEPAVVQADGFFELKDVYDGRYRVLFSVRSQQPDDQDFYLKAASIAEEDVLKHGVLVSEGHVAGVLELVISSASSRIDGVVVGRDGAPAAGAHVAVVREEDARRRARVAPTTVSDQEGRFLVRGLPPGNYKLYAWDRVDEEDVPWSEPELLQTYENQAQTVSVRENERKEVEVKAIKRGEEP